MKKFALVLVAFLTMAMGFKAHAIEDPFPAGTIIGSARVGFLPGIGANISGDYVLVDSWWKGHFTVGGFFGYNHRKYFGYDNYWSNLALLPRATYGLNITNEFEVHAGMLTGVAIRGYRSVSQEPHYQNYVVFEIAGIAGARYRLIGDLYADFEVYLYPGSMSCLNLGVSYMF